MTIILLEYNGLNATSYYYLLETWNAQQNYYLKIKIKYEDLYLNIRRHKIN